VRCRREGCYALGCSRPHRASRPGRLVFRLHRASPRAGSRHASREEKWCRWAPRRSRGLGPCCRMTSLSRPSARAQAERCRCSRGLLTPLASSAGGALPVSPVPRALPVIHTAPRPIPRTEAEGCPHLAMRTTRPCRSRAPVRPREEDSPGARSACRRIDRRRALARRPGKRARCCWVSRALPTTPVPVGSPCGARQRPRGFPSGRPPVTCVVRRRRVRSRCVRPTNCHHFDQPRPPVPRRLPRRPSARAARPREARCFTTSMPLRWISRCIERTRALSAASYRQEPPLVSVARAARHAPAQGTSGEDPRRDRSSARPVKGLSRR